MPKFTLRKNENSKSKIEFNNLIIDGEDQFDKFQDDLEEIYRSEFRSLSSFINILSENRQLSSGKKRKLQGLENTWELRTKNLRLYFVVINEYGHAICLGGMKKNQDKDLRRVESLHKQILTQIEKEGLPKEG